MLSFIIQLATSSSVVSKDSFHETFSLPLKDSSHRNASRYEDIRLTLGAWVNLDTYLEGVDLQGTSCKHHPHLSTHSYFGCVSTNRSNRWSHTHRGVSFSRSSR